MLGATPLTAIFGSGVDSCDHEAMRGYLRAAAAAGLSVLFVQPGTKAPADLRTSQRRNADDRAAREVARAAGRRDWERVRSASGLALATSDADTLVRYLNRYVELYSTGDQPVAVNLAVELGGSRLVVVDCDTTEQVAEFLAMSNAPDGVPPTVTTPGSQSPDGTWKHDPGCGHFYFTVPEGTELPDDLGSITLGRSKFAVLWSHRYALIPPSVRPEGRYELTGRDYELPDWLTEHITTACTERRERATANRDSATNSALGSSIDAWASRVSWASLLEPLEWVPVSTDASCGCPEWTAAGEHANPRSAIAHDAGCARGWESSDTNAPLHIWTDHPGEPFESWIASGHSATITKFQAIALIEYGGDMGAAVEGLGLSPEQVQLEGVSIPGLRRDVGDISGLRAENTSAAANLRTEIDPAWTEQTTAPDYVMAPIPPVEQMSLAQLAGRAEPGEEPGEEDTAFPNVGTKDPDTGMYLPQNDGMPRIAPLSFWADVSPPEFVIEGMFEHGGLSALIGSPGAGKSSVALDMLCHIATGRSWQGKRVLKTKVLYLPGEGMSGAVQRLLVWCEARGLSPAEVGVEIGQPIIQLGASPEAWAELRAYVAANEIGLIAFDTFARMARGIDENSATEVGLAIGRFDMVRELTNCGVLVVHHTGKGANATVARGSSALNGAVDSEVLVVAEADRVQHGDGWARPIRLKATKQKNAEYDDEWTELLMTNWQDRAPLITGPNGNIDPMQGEILMARPVAEPLIETAVRIRAWVDRFTEQGVTRTDIVAGVEPDPFTRERRNAAQHWRLKVAEAVDRGLRYGLLQTLTGAPSGSRYIPGPTGVEAARALAADEVMLPGA